MFEYIYEWIENVAFYLVLATAVLHVIPNQEYRKYIRFFTGLVLILMLAAPILKIMGTEIRVQDFMDSGAELYKEYSAGTGEMKSTDIDTEFSEGREQEETEIGVEQIQVEW